MCIEAATALHAQPDNPLRRRRGREALRDLLATAIKATAIRMAPAASPQQHRAQSWRLRSAATQSRSPAAVTATAALLRMRAPTARPSAPGTETAMRAAMAMLEATETG